MRNTIQTLFVVAALVGMAACASASQTYTWQDIKQQSGPVVFKPEAYLKVYSEARVYMDADVPRVDRVPYTIYSADGKKLRQISFNGEDPKVVTLPPGKYLIVPQTNLTKTEAYGAILKDGQLTEVHMSGENPTYAPVNF
jgi:hypothetical protein